MKMDAMNINAEANSPRKNRCFKTGRWIGAISGSVIGLLHFYWLVNVSSPHSPFWKDLVTGIPATIVSTYMGAKTTKWATEQIMKGNPKLWKAALKGAMYGAIDGSIILTASYVPFLITGYYLETLHFNLSDNLIILKLLGLSPLGGIVYGGTIGAMVGAVCGLCISLYMKF